MIIAMTAAQPTLIVIESVFRQTGNADALHDRDGPAHGPSQRHPDQPLGGRQGATGASGSRLSADWPDMAQDRAATCRALQRRLPGSARRWRLRQAARWLRQED